MSVQGLDLDCPVCGRESGEHTLREWSACLGKPTTDLPFERTPPDLAAAAADAVRQQFQLDPDTIVADSVVIRAAVLDGGTAGVGVKLPALLHEFQVGVPGGPPQTVAKVIFMGGAEAVRRYGELAADSANGAIEAAEGRG